MGKRSRHSQNRDGLLASLFRGLFSGDGPGRASRQRKELKARCLRFEGVEDRRLLSVSAVWNASSGLLALTGDGAANQVAVIGQSSYVDIYVGGHFQARLSDANSGNVNTINFDGKLGNDSLSVQNIQPSGSLTIGSAGGFTSVESLSVVKSQNVTVTATGNGFSFGTSSITGNLTVTAAGGLTQTGPVVVGGTTTLTLSTGNITLTNPSNNFVTVDVDANNVGGQNVSLRDVNSLVLAQSEVTGNLSVQASLSSSSRGSLTQSGYLTVGGSTTLAVGTASTITLDDTANVLHGPGGALSITSAGTATIMNDGNLTLGASTVTGNLTVDTSGSAYYTGAISQSGRLVVGKTATFYAPSDQNITLTNAANNFGTVIAEGNDVDLRDVNSLALGASTVTGDLSVTTGGAITQTGALYVYGDTTLNAGAANNITLNRSYNAFYGPLTITGRNVTLVNGYYGYGMWFGNSTISGTLSATALGGDITQNYGTALSVAGKATFTARGADVTLDQANFFKEVAVTSAASATLVDSAGGLALGASRLTGDLDVETPGPLTQTGAISASGYTTLNATGAGGALNDITLKNSSNNFNILTVTEGRDVSLADVNNLDFGDVGATGVGAVRNLNVGVRGSLSQTGGDLFVSGTTTLSAGRASAITLGGDNELTGAVSIASAGNVTLKNTLATKFGASNVTGSLTVTSADGITQSGKIVVGTTADLTAGGAITLSDPNNNFYIAEVSGGAVELWDVNSIFLGASSSTSLKVVAGKSIGQTGALTVQDGTILEAGPSDSITLTNDSNDFGATAGSVALTAGKNVAIVDSNNIDFEASQVGGTFNVTAGGNITDSGELEITGKTTLSATGNVEFDEADNFSEVAVTTAVNVTLYDVDALRLGASTITGDLFVLTGGPITQSGPLSVNGASATATFVTDGSDITLTDDGNDFTTVEGFGGNVSLKDQNALDLGDLWVMGNLKVTTDGAITDSDTVTVATGTTTLDAGAGNNITLDNGDDFEVVAVISANDVSLNDINALALGTSNVSGDLTVTAGGEVTQTGGLTVEGTLGVTATGFDIKLDDDQNDFYLVNADGADVTLFDSNTEGISLNDLTVTGDLYVDAAGDITSVGDLIVSNTAKTATFIAEDAGGTTFDIVLGAAGTCQISAKLSLVGHDLTVTNDAITVLGDCTADGDLTVTSTVGGSSPTVNLTNDLGGGASGKLNVQYGKTTLTAEDGDLHLIATGCAFGTFGDDWSAAEGAGVLALSAPNGTVTVDG